MSASEIDLEALEYFRDKMLGAKRQREWMEMIRPISDLVMGRSRQIMTTVTPDLTAGPRAQVIKAVRELEELEAKDGSAERALTEQQDRLMTALKARNALLEKWLEELQ